jgi:hypothetical protein
MQIHMHNLILCRHIDTWIDTHLRYIHSYIHTYIRNEQYHPGHKRDKSGIHTKRHKHQRVVPAEGVHSFCFLQHRILLDGKGRHVTRKHAWSQAVDSDLVGRESTAKRLRQMHHRTCTSQHGSVDSYMFRSSSSTHSIVSTWWLLPWIHRHRGNFTRRAVER